MKKVKIFVLLFAIFASAIIIHAQKIGVVDTNYVLSKMPQYKDAEKRLNDQIEAWQQEISAKQSELDKKKAEFENERVLLVGDQLKKRQKEVDDMEKEFKKMIEVRFGTNGEINKARSSLAKPFQDQIYNAILTVSQKNSLGIVLDKSNDVNVIFLEKRYDYTDKVLDLLLKNSDTETKKTNQRSTLKKDKRN